MGRHSQRASQQALNHMLGMHGSTSTPRQRQQDICCCASAVGGHTLLLMLCCAGARCFDVDSCASLCQSIKDALCAMLCQSIRTSRCRPTVVSTQEAAAVLTWLAFLPRPMRKLSGLMSRWMKLRECTYSMRAICTASHTRLHEGSEQSEPCSTGGVCGALLCVHI